MTNYLDPKDPTTLTNSELKRLKGIGHKLKAVVTVGNNGLTETVLDEINRALEDHELIKIKIPSGSKVERDNHAAKLATESRSQVIHSIGRMILLLRRNPSANPKLSNLIRYSNDD